MLNISDNPNEKLKSMQTYKTVKGLNERPHYQTLNKVIIGSCISAVLFLFVPWTQNISGTGSVTTLKPNQRAQTIQNGITGRIEKWYVQEGDTVKRGDTILYMSEVKEEYFDPNLVKNTKEQVDAKTQSFNSYDGKVNALQNQIAQLERERQLKLQQAQNKIKQGILKIQSDSIDLEAVKTQLRIATTQFNRSTTLEKDGLKPVTDVEEKRLKLQDVQAKIITQENKLLISQNEILNTQMEISRLNAEYAEKIAKADSDKFTALGNQFDTQAQVTKLENQYANYSIRNDLYYIRAPQDGIVNRALQSGLGEIIKEGSPVVSLMPLNYDIAVETFVNPIDIPLLKSGERVRVWFDGWPTIVFSGWPGMSYGTFGGRVVAIENFISPNGKYRILIAPDSREDHWPTQLSIGAGAQTIALLETVPIGFEIWRVLNGFPPNYYEPTAGANAATKK
jgi:multidrug efflux pump subunit AcrA (membrane-fusion protein)